MSQSHRLWFLRLNESSPSYDEVKRICCSLSYCIYAYIKKKEESGEAYCNIMIKFENVRTLSSIKKYFSDDVIVISNSGNIREFLYDKGQNNYLEIVTNNKVELPYLLGTLKRGPKVTIKRIYDYNKKDKIMSIIPLEFKYGPSVFDEPYHTIINDLIAENTKSIEK